MVAVSAGSVVVVVVVSVGFVVVVAVAVVVVVVSTGTETGAETGSLGCCSASVAKEEVEVVLERGDILAFGWLVGVGF